MKKLITSIIAVFIAWSLIDLLVHGILLKDTYETTANLWRPMAEMKMGLMHVITLIYAGLFVFLFYLLIKPKTLNNGLKYGILFGLVSGLNMGFGSYTFLPIPLSLATVWFFYGLISCVVGGLIAGAILKTKKR